MRRRTLRSPFRTRGFSLLEAIVTLVVVAMIVALLMQALSQSLNLRTRLLRHQGAALVAGLQEQWFRESVSAGVADLPDALGVPLGTPDALEMLTARSLDTGGSLQRIRWSLRAVPGGGSSLHYADATWDDLVVVDGPLHGAAFTYLDASGEWRDGWEPVPESEHVLPRMVRLRARTADGTLDWLVPVAADPRSLHTLRPDGSGDGI